MGGWVTYYPDALRHREEAAESVMERIESDLEEAPWRVRPLLEHLREHLFDPDLTVASMRRACGVGDHSISTVFHSAMGEPPRSYLEARRLEVAERLLRGTELLVWQVAELVGYERPQAFRRAFRRRLGVRPGMFREVVSRTA